MNGAERVVESFFFFNDTATTEIYTLSLHDALPIWPAVSQTIVPHSSTLPACHASPAGSPFMIGRSEEHTSELQSPDHLVCRLLLEKNDEVEPVGSLEHCFPVEIGGRGMADRLGWGV